MKALSIPAASLAAIFAFVPMAQGQQGETPPDTVSSSAGDISIEELATLEFPWGMEWLPDGRLLITEKPGRLRIWQDGSLSEPVEGVPEVSYIGGMDQGGLLDVTVDPDFADNGYIYLSYSEAADQQPESVAETGDARFGPFLDASADSTIRGGAVARARLEDNRLSNVEVIWRQVPKTIGRGHFGHRLLFGEDGKLYITSGDRMRFEPAQSPLSNLGKVVRINTDGSEPDDNPQIGEGEGEGNARGDIWSTGHRNILSAAFEPETGNLWALEMGPLGGDELNLVEAGKDYGWPSVSDGSQYGGQTITGHPASMEAEAPVRTWTPVISPSGAHFYDGELFTDWQGDLLAGGLSSQALVRLDLDGDRVALEERLDLRRRVRDVQQDADGAILLLIDAQEGSLLRLTPNQ